MTENERDLPDVGVLLAHTDHDTLVTGTADDGPRDNGDQQRIGASKEMLRTGTRHAGHRRLK